MILIYSTLAMLAVVLQYLLYAFIALALYSYAVKSRPTKRMGFFVCSGIFAFNIVFFTTAYLSDTLYQTLPMGELFLGVYIALNIGSGILGAKLSESLLVRRRSRK